MQSFALQVLEHEKRALVGRRRVFVDRDKVAMPNLASSFASREKLVDGKAAFRLPDSDRDLALHVRIRRQKHLRLRSAPQAPLDSISVVQGFADHLHTPFPCVMGSRFNESMVTNRTASLQAPKSALDSAPPSVG